MCRLLGIVASEPTAFRLVLREAPRSLASLSEAHPDGWGIGIHVADTPDGVATRAKRWHLQKGIERAAADPTFHALAAQCEGHVLVAHIRQKTVGPTRIENTHPFARDGWIFAHNGTLPKTEWLAERLSDTRRSEIAGDTDSEVLFAYLLTKLDEAGLTHLSDAHSRTAASTLLRATAKDLRTRDLGAFNFLLSDGQTCFAHRFGRSLFVLAREPGDPVRNLRQVTPATSLATPWTERRAALFVASERITDEPWCEVPDATFLRIDRLPLPHIVDYDGTSDAVAS